MCLCLPVSCAAWTVACWGIWIEGKAELNAVADSGIKEVYYIYHSSMGRKQSAVPCQWKGCYKIWNDPRGMTTSHCVNPTLSSISEQD